MKLRIAEKETIKKHMPCHSVKISEIGTNYVKFISVTGKTFGSYEVSEDLAAALNIFKDEWGLLSAFSENDIVYFCPDTLWNRSAKKLF